MLVATEQQLRDGVDLGAESLAVIEDGFARLGRGEADIPPIMGLEIPKYNGAADVKAAYVAGWDSFAIKISTRFFDNPKHGLPSGSGLMSLFDGTTGQPQAVFLDNGYLTTVRTALAGAVAAKYLAREVIATVAVIGAGSQARWQTRALALVRDFSNLRVTARDVDAAKNCASELADALGVEAWAEASAEAAVRAADIVITTTAAQAPVLQADWLQPGTHVTAMGSDAAHKNEIDPMVFQRADVRVCDLISQSYSRGEMRHVDAAEHVAADAVDIRELGAIVNGDVAGRENDRQISICDLTGVGVQDTAIARYALHTLQANGAEGAST